MNPIQLGSLYFLSYMKGYLSVLLQFCHMLIGKSFPIKKLFLLSIGRVVLDYLYSLR